MHAVACRRSPFGGTGQIAETTCFHDSRLLRSGFALTGKQEGTELLLVCRRYGNYPVLDPIEMPSGATFAVSLLRIEGAGNQSLEQDQSFDTWTAALSFQSSIEEVNVVPSILLGPIHSRVCTLDQSLPIPTVLGKDADAYAGGDMKNVRCEVIWERDCGENLFRDWHQIFPVVDL